MEELTVKVDGKEYKVFVEESEDGKMLVHSGNEVYEVETKKDIAPATIERLRNKNSDDVREIVAPLPGTVYAIKVKKGDKIKAGKSMFTLMAMKMENDVAAPRDCVVKEVKAKKGATVAKGDVLAVIG